LQVKDNGVGSDKILHFSSSRLGLRGMRERVQALNGKIEIDSRAGQGFAINVTLPPEVVESGDTSTRKVL
jgi:signal transduction histidine kinase